MRFANSEFPNCTCFHSCHSLLTFMTLVHKETDSSYINFSNMAVQAVTRFVLPYILPFLACSVFVPNLADWNNALQGFVNSGLPHTGVFSSLFLGQCHGVASVVMLLEVITGASHSRQSSCQWLVHLVNESYGSSSVLTVSGQPFLPTTGTRSLLRVVHPCECHWLVNSCTL